MTESVKIENTGSRKKKIAGITAGVGVLGIAALAIGGTTANWTDSESAGAEFTAGQLDLEIATTAVGESPVEEDWVSGTTVSDVDVISSIESITAWGPGDQAEGVVHVRLAEGTTHNAELVSDRVTDDSAGWTVTGPDEVNQVLNTGEVADFPVVVEMDADPENEFQGAAGEVVWEFNAQQQAQTTID